MQRVHMIKRGHLTNENGPAENVASVPPVAPQGGSRPAAPVAAVVAARPVAS